MTIQRRMTQQSARQLRSGDDIAVTYLAGAQGYTIDVDGALVCASDGPMYYPTPSAAMRAIRRIRPDLSDANVPITYQSTPGPRPRLIQADPDDAERILEDLHEIQRYASALVEELEQDPATDSTRHHFRANSLLSRLHALEHDLLACPPTISRPSASSE